MSEKQQQDLVELDPAASIWEQFFGVYPLVLVGTREPDGGADLAPKHLAMPMSWINHFGFVCAPTHGTYKNINREREFTVTYARPDAAVLASLAASPRCGDGTKPITETLPTFPATKVDAPFLQDGYVFLECTLHQVVDGLGNNALIIGRIVAAHAREEVLRKSDFDDMDLVRASPLLAYLYPGRFAEISDSTTLPFPAGFKR